jgi:hypothetical protein
MEDTQAKLAAVQLCSDRTNVSVNVNVDPCGDPNKCTWTKNDTCIPTYDQLAVEQEAQAAIVYHLYDLMDGIWAASYKTHHNQDGFSNLEG